MLNVDTDKERDMKDCAIEGEANAKAIAAIPRMCAGLETAHKALTAEYERRQTSGVPEYIKEAWLALAAVHEAMTAAGYQF